MYFVVWSGAWSLTTASTIWGRELPEPPLPCPVARVWMSSADVVVRRTLPLLDESSRRFSSDLRVESFLLALRGPAEGVLDAEEEEDLWRERGQEAYL